MNAKQFVEYAESIYRPSAELISLAPSGKLDWKPAHGNYMSLGQPVNTMTLYMGA